MKKLPLKYAIGAFLMLMVLTTMLVPAIAQTDVKPGSRITLKGAHPDTPPTDFLKNRDLWVDTIANQTWLWIGGTSWRLAPAQIGKGEKGDPGSQGKE